MGLATSLNAELKHNSPRGIPRWDCHNVVTAMKINAAPLAHFP
jgi:hypothetical protein